MFERVLDFIAASWNILRPLVVVSDFEGGVILRFGRYNRVITPGLHWKIPLAENAIVTSTVITTMALRPQTLTTKDDLTLVLSAIVKYHMDARSSRPSRTRCRATVCSSSGPHAAASRRSGSREWSGSPTSPGCRSSGST